jgi:hypothetical protein
MDVVFSEVRKFIFSSYHDLPNILFMGSLILGSLLGYLPLIWMALGLILTAFVVAGLQQLTSLSLQFIKSDGWKSQVKITGADYQKCFVGFKANPDAKEAKDFFGSLTGDGDVIALPSYWMSATSFFAVFSIYNSVRVAAREPKRGVDPQLVSARRAFSISTAIVGLIFLALVALRFFTGCETMAGWLVGLLVGGGMGVGFWHILDACGTGKLPDILQVVGSMAPETAKTQQPIMCVPPAQ